MIEQAAMLNILLTRELPPAMMDALGQFGELTLLSKAISLSELEPSIIVSTAVDQVNVEMIEACTKSLGLIANIGVGTDNIDLQAAADAGVQVANTPVVTEDTADLAMALLLAACRKMRACEQALREGDWAKGASILGQRVHGKTLGIVGAGAIGQALARRASGFEMPIVYTGPSRKSEFEQNQQARYVADLNALLEQVDIISLHCPLSESTRHILDAEQFARCKSSAVLVNTGRGALVNESALVNALKTGQIAGAGLDVFEFEPQVSTELLEMDNVSTLPHIGSATGECRADMAACTVGNIQSFLQQGSALHRAV